MSLLCHLVFQVLINLELGCIFPCRILKKRRKEESLGGKGIHKTDPITEEGRMRENERVIWNKKLLMKFKKVGLGSGPEREEKHSKRKVSEG